MGFVATGPCGYCNTRTKHQAGLDSGPEFTATGLDIECHPASLALGYDTTQALPLPVSLLSPWVQAQNGSFLNSLCLSSDLYWNVSLIWFWAACSDKPGRLPEEPLLIYLKFTNVGICEFVLSENSDSPERTPPISYLKICFYLSQSKTVQEEQRSTFIKSWF